ncbi:MAG: protein-methionine-sulfoxide reductase heme-binding subunit MsrQ [Acidobacteriaceae bacterium]
MNKGALISLKVAVWIACLAPLGLLVYRGFTNDLGPDPTATVTHATGFATLRLLLISLAVTPVRRLFTQLSWLIRFRRLLGLFAFFYGCLHLLTWLWLYSGFSLAAMADDLGKRRYIMAGMTAWVLLFPLAATSTKWSIRKLGGKRWQMLHRLAYVSAICGVIHYWWIVKSGVRTPITVTLVLAALFTARILWAVRERWSRQPQVTAAR